MQPDKKTGLHFNTFKLQVFLVLLLACVSVAALMTGQLRIHPYEVVKIILSGIFHIEKTWSPTLESVLFDVRLPRLIAGILVGAGLSVSGASFQGLFRNPLVSPHILGVSAGAGLGAALAILFFSKIYIVQLFSFLFGLLAVLMTYSLSRVYRTTPVLMLVLSGMIVGALFSAGTSLLKYIADPVNQMPSIVFWMLGSLNNASNKDLIIAGPVMLGGIVVLLLIRWRINLLAMGEEEARSLGVETGRIRAVIIFCATVISASAVSISGIIGWIGLVIPHIGRILVGPDNKKLLPVVTLIGAIYLVIVDTIARTAIESEIPIGVLTAIAGAPIFAYLLRKNRSGW
ncbi:MAG TPA: iron ABC transporter permease [Syntrophorhabdaceae bacterium]|jgi:iron complex transport system permease protein|nr:MAG: putative ABC transporter permease protein [Deltaproteobacteria bacterium ADurb.Bin135]HNQ63146.1 iron ABC transporter permease [Syntrophorhabdaceae bacterium]HOB69060.1 iron ABC transporter permease [Syntrophorhabdaceae bacterium]HOG40024.1 iron ABC transporter permease [Syntrophorhabdaceae bacterium]HOS05147.1 iron ABC transporter permease [Syntrophorhabdaceae bacterium]